MYHVQRKLHHIHSALAQASTRSEVRITTAGNELRVDVRATDILSRFLAQMWRIISAVAALFDGSIAREKTGANEAYDCFKRFFGEKRIERLQKQYGFSLEESAPTCFDIEKLFTAAATISKTDIQELLQEIQENETIRDCTNEESETLRCRFKGKILADCSKEDLDLLISCLAPFDGNNCFISKAPTHTLPFSTFEMQRQLVHNLRTLTHKNWSHVEWANYVGKCVTPRDPSIGTLIPHPHGYYEIMERIETNGACAFLLRPVGNAPLAPLVLFRGTRSVFPGDLQNPQATLESLKEDLYEEIGREGVISSYNSLKKYLCEPELGFVSHPNQKIWGVGYSLGGAQLQRTAIVFHARFDLIVTVASPGIEKESAALYAALLKEAKQYPTIHHIVDFADLVPLFGDCHLGHTCTSEDAQVTVHIYQEELESAAHLWQLLTNIPGISHIGSFAKIFAHFPRAHTQAAHIVPHKVFRFSQISTHVSKLIQEVAQQAHSLSDYDWEYIRKKFFALKTSSSFTTFVRQTKILAI